MVPAVVLPCMRCWAYREMKVLRPVKTMERKTTARDSFTNEATSSAPRGASVLDAPASGRASIRSTGTHRAAPASAGRTRTGVQRREPCPITADTMSGASAKPMLPPRENQPIAL